MFVIKLRFSLPGMLLQTSYLLAKFVPHYLQVGNRVWCFKNTEDTGASW